MLPITKSKVGVSAIIICCIADTPLIRPVMGKARCAKRATLSKDIREIFYSFRDMIWLVLYQSSRLISSGLM